MTDKQIKDEIKQVVTNLGNIKFTVEDELEFCKQVLKRKEQECENWKRQAELGVDTTNILTKELKEKEQECEELKEVYSELTDIVSPYMNDFTGYNEELDSFDIILCIKELLKEKSDLKEYRLQELEYIRTMLVCLLANEENAKQAHKINHLINEIIKWQNLEDK